MKNLLLSVMLIAMVSMLLVACQNERDAAKEDEVAKSELLTFGEESNIDGAISYPELLVNLGNKDSLAMKVVGKVSGVCQAKGCWLTMTTESPSDPEMMVKFRDYGFFVPKDIEGREVVLDGVAYNTITSVEDLQHLARDAGKSEEAINAITEPQETLEFIADGVVLLPADAPGKS